ncbi:AAA family ATPase [archaeon]|jgi:archaeal cell division control protein 6|nr:AAA family ATPase [archaeon]MBT6698268.1 AAA family ATPase [archaeon]
MSIFKEMLKSGETLFRDTIVLDYDFQPKILKFRENEQARFAVAIRPLFQNHSGKNLFVYGAPGIGKTTACKNVIRELEEETDDIYAIYVNCWKFNTTFKVFNKICEELGFRFIQNKKTSELFALIKEKLNKTAAVFIFDEIDKLEDTDFLYTILEDIYRKTIILLTNYRDTYSEMDERIRSRLSPEFLHFREYKESEVKGILEERRKYAFVQNCWNEEAFDELVLKCTQTMDLRIGLYLMKEAGNIAEEKANKKITVEHVARAIQKVDEFYIKPKEALPAELLQILDLIKSKPASKIGDVYNEFCDRGSEMSYKSFQRRIVKLEQGKYIQTQKKTTEKGNTTILHYNTVKKLSEF